MDLAGDRFVLCRTVALPRPVLVPVIEAVHPLDAVDDAVEAAADHPRNLVGGLRFAALTRLAGLTTHVRAEVTLRKARRHCNAVADDGDLDRPHQPIGAGYDPAGRQDFLVNLGVWNGCHCDFPLSPNNQRHSLTVEGRPAEADLS